LKICYTSDLHGNLVLYQQLLHLIIEENVEALLLGGDQCPSKSGSGAIEYQKHWLLTSFREFLQLIQYRCQVYWTSGNHDLAGTLNIIKDFERANLIIQCNLRKSFLCEGWAVIGFPFLPINDGWPYKDWERLDVNQTLKFKDKRSIYITQNGRLEQIQLNEWLQSSQDIESLLNEMLGITLSNKTVLVSHCPPFKSGLDENAFHKSIGTKALLNFLLNAKITLACHGHVHEAPYITHKWIQTINSTVCINPGQWGKQLHAIIFDINDIHKSIKHTIFGKIEDGKIPYIKSKAIQKEIKQYWKTAMLSINQ